MGKVTTWNARAEYVDEETGEVINKKDIDNYTITKKTKTYEIKEETGTTVYINECRRKPAKQGELFEGINQKKRYRRNTVRGGNG